MAWQKGRYSSENHQSQPPDVEWSPTRSLLCQAECAAEWYSFLPQSSEIYTLTSFSATGTSDGFFTHNPRCSCLKAEGDSHALVAQDMQVCMCSLSAAAPVVSDRRCERRAVERAGQRSGGVPPYIKAAVSTRDGPKS